MPTRNINLTPEMDAQIAERITSGDYANASEVVRAGLRALRREEEDRAKLQALRDALIEGENSGYPEEGGESVFEEVLDDLRKRGAKAPREAVGA